jgi:hypothetical protein
MQNQQSENTTGSFDPQTIDPGSATSADSILVLETPAPNDPSLPKPRGKCVENQFEERGNLEYKLERTKEFGGLVPEFYGQQYWRCPSCLSIYHDINNARKCCGSGANQAQTFFNSQEEKIKQAILDVLGVSRKYVPVRTLIDALPYDISFDLGPLCLHINPMIASGLIQKRGKRRGTAYRRKKHL